LSSLDYLDEVAEIVRLEANIGGVPFHAIRHVHLNWGLKQGGAAGEQDLIRRISAQNDIYMCPFAINESK
jgi:hypothetical protein